MDEDETETEERDRHADDEGRTFRGWCMTDAGMVYQFEIADCGSLAAFCERLEAIPLRDGDDTPIVTHHAVRGGL